MVRISEATRQTCFFAVRYRQEVHYIEAVYPNAHEPTRNILGERAPMYCTGLGKAMMAFMPEEETEAMMAGSMEPYTSFTLTDPVKLREELAAIRMRGYAVDNMEHEFGLRCVAVPVFDTNGQVMAAISVSGLSSFFDDETVARYGQTLREILQPLQHRVECARIFE